MKCSAWGKVPFSFFLFICPPLTFFFFFFLLYSFPAKITAINFSQAAFGDHITYQAPGIIEEKKKAKRKLELTLVLKKIPVALLIVIKSGFSCNPSHSAPCTVTLDFCRLCVVTEHTEPEI